MTDGRRRYRPRLPLPEKFWAQVDTSGDCWEWTGSKFGSNSGYGYLKANGRKEGAHRYSWELAHGQRVPGGLHVLHRCDNPGCVNPAHLFLGTHADNMADKMAKGRHRAGRKSDLPLDRIRSRLQEGGTLRGIGAEFGVSRQTILRIKKRAA